MKVVSFKDNVVVDKGRLMSVIPASNKQIVELVDEPVRSLFTYSVVASLIERIKVEMGEDGFEESDE